jgi:hypothetical protein
MATRKRRVHLGGDERGAVHAPDWTTGNDHDPGVTLLALFAFLGVSLLWQSSGRGEGAASRLPRAVAVGLGAASAVWLLLRLRRRRGPLCAREPSS